MEQFIKLYNQIDLNTFCSFMLFSVLSYTLKYLKRDTKEIKYLKKVTIVLALELMIEPMCFILEDFRIPSLVLVTYLTEFVNFMLVSFISYYWVLFTYHYVHKKDPYESTNRTILLLLPLMVATELVLTNYITGAVYTISPENEYARGPLFPLITVINGIYIIYSMILLFRGRNKITKKEYYIFLLYNILPVIGILIQTFFKGTTFSYSFTAFVLVLLYVFLENKIVKLDHLTKVYARTFLDAYIDNIESKKTTKCAIAFIDLDEFKGINDKYGHAEGDFALVKFAEILNKSMPEEAIVSRFGGDEFVVIFNTNNVEKLEKHFEEFKENLDRYNKKNSKRKGYEIKYSVGYDVISNGYNSVKELLRKVDDKMYQEKLRKKVNRKSIEE